MTFCCYLVNGGHDILVVTNALKQDRLQGVAKALQSYAMKILAFQAICSLDSGLSTTNRQDWM